MEADKFSPIDPILDDITEIIEDQFESEHQSVRGFQEN